MEESQATLLEQLANWKVILVVFLATIAFNLFVFSGRTRELRLDSGLANPILDTRFSYTPDEAYKVMKDLKPEGRRLYVITNASEDLVFPLLYNLFLALTLTAVFQAAFSSSSRTLFGKPGARLTVAGEKAAARLKSLAHLPLLVLVCDYAENICLIILMVNFPSRLNWLARLASVFTSLKWFSGTLCAVLIVFGLLIWGARKLGVKT
jgi:hypothetical protein